MIASLLLAGAIALPAPGTYTYEIDASNGARYSTTVSITREAGGVRTHEAFGAPSVIATTDQQFDSDLHERSFSATQLSTGNSITITFSDTTATYRVRGKTFHAPLDDADCVLVEDNILTSAVMLPAVLQAETVPKCVFALSTSVATLNADLISAQLVHSPRAAPGDAYVAIQIGGIMETVWYDPQTLIPDYVDFGENVGNAVLIR